MPRAARPLRARRQASADGHHQKSDDRSAKIRRFVRKRTCRGWLKNCSKDGFPARTSCSGKWCATNQNFLEGDPGARKIEASWPARPFGRARSVYIRRHPHHMGRKDRISLGYELVPQGHLSGADRAAARAGSFDDTLLTLLFAIRDWVTHRRVFEAMSPIRPPTTSGRAGGIRRQNQGHQSQLLARFCRRTAIDPELILAGDKVGALAFRVLYRDGERSPSSEFQGLERPTNRDAAAWRTFRPRASSNRPSCF